MDGNYIQFPADGGFIYDQSLDFVSEDLDNRDEHKPSPSSVTTVHSGDHHQGAPDSARKLPRTQRRKSLTSEQTKHRRTRSGCYTCRQRRVKCDELRPICDRCRKGKRDCTYPDKTAAARSSRSVQKSKSPSTASSPASSDEQDDFQQPSTTSDDLESTSAVASRPVRADSKRSTILEEYNGAVIQMQNQLDGVIKPAPLPILEQIPDWKTYPKDVRFYLKYFRENITYCHYAFKNDTRDFLQSSFLEVAIEFKPLLYSLVAFTAYHYALRNPASKPDQFLDYYDQSLSLFRAALANGESAPVPVLLTMLQLATIEEFLGDWVSLLNHQRAAATLMQETLTPEAMTQSFTHRLILVWYWRFDLFAGVLSGSALTLPRRWFAHCVESCARSATSNTDGNLGVWLDHFFTNSRLLVTDVTLLFASRQAATFDEKSFEESAIQLWARIKDNGQRVDKAFRDVPYFNDTWLETEGNLTDYKDPHFLFLGPYFGMNYILADSWVGRIIFMCRINLLRSRGLYTHAEPVIEPEEILRLCLKTCKMLEAIQYSEAGPAGAVLCLQAALGVIAFFIPHEPEYIDWTRRKLALMEANGYIYPASYRSGMSMAWKLDVNYWWLPDGEGLTPLHLSMRQLIDIRRKSAHRQPDDQGVDVRDMNGIFRRMRLAAESAATDAS